MTALTIGEWVNLIGTVATVLMAGGTVYLAIVTQKLAKGAADGIKQADRHHQENLRPFCVLDFAHATETHPFGVDFDSQSSGKSIPIRGSVQNKGDGPARDVFVYLNARLGEGEDGAVRLTRPVLASGLVAARETAAIEVQITERDIMLVVVAPRWRSACPPDHYGAELIDRADRGRRIVDRRRDRPQCDVDDLHDAEFDVLLQGASRAEVDRREQLKRPVLRNALAARGPQQGDASRNELTDAPLQPETDPVRLGE